MTAHLLVDESPTNLDGDVAATATLSPCRTYRYALTRRWNPAVEGVAFCMLNPSTADALADDPTIRRCVGFAKAWGYGALLVVNLFGLRATNPDELYTHPDPVGPDNNAVLTEWAERIGGPIVAAWGVHGRHLDRGRQVTALLRQHGARVMCLGTTKDGHPRHPLYLRADTLLTEFDGGSRG